MIAARSVLDVRPCGCCATRATPAASTAARREPPADVSVSHLAELGALVGDPARANMLVALFRAGSLTARELADGAGVTPQTASGHLGRLLGAGLVTVERRGRYHDYRLASDEAGALLSALHVAGARLRTRPPPLSGSARTDRWLLRACRQHMAGRLAVALAETLFDGTMDPGRGLAGPGRGLLARWGLERAPAEPAAADGCLDWSEAAPHIGGELGAAMLSHSLSLGWVRKAGPGAQLALTPAGRVGFQHRFGLRLERIGAD